MPILGKWSELSELEQKFNSHLAHHRIVIENVNRECKKWKICQHTFRAKTNDLDVAAVHHNKVWVTVCGLVNELHGPLRRRSAELD